MSTFNNSIVDAVRGLAHASGVSASLRYLHQTAESGRYTLTYNPFMGHVALYRHANPAPVQERAPRPQPKLAARRRRGRAASYQQAVRRPSADTPRGLGL